MPPTPIHTHPAVRWPRLGGGGWISRSPALIVSFGATRLRPVRRCLRPSHMKTTAAIAVKAASWRCWVWLFRGEGLERLRRH